MINSWAIGAARAGTVATTRCIALGFVLVAIAGAPSVRAEPPAVSPTRQQAAQNACANAQLADYKMANLQILQSQAGQPFNLAAALVARRRALERFCRRFTQCIDPGDNGAAFDSCRRDEEREEWSFPEGF